MGWRQCILLIGYTITLLALLVALLSPTVSPPSSPSSPSGVGGLRLGLVPPTQQCVGKARATNPIMAENTCPGTDSWQMNLPLGPEHAIEAFTTPASINIGQPLRIYVSTTASLYTMQIYRMGWYQGLGARLMAGWSDLPGIKQPNPTFAPSTRTISCENWREPLILTIPDDWVSGVYIIKLVSSEGYMRYTLFTVRDDSSHAPILFETSLVTYQAYNIWGGYSLYHGKADPNGPYTYTGNTYPGDKRSVHNHIYTNMSRAYMVSFDRPYYDYDGDPGLGNFPRYEYNLLRWFEREGYNMTYATDLDNAGPLGTLTQHNLIVVDGHSEYWSTGMRAHVTAARDAGVSFAFFGGNDLYWHVRLAASPLGPNREVICYKAGPYYAQPPVDPVAASNPREDTVRWRDAPINTPENLLLGESYGGAVKWAAPVVLSEGAQPFLRSTGLAVGSALPGLVFDEFDRYDPDAPAPAPVTILASSPLECSYSSLCDVTSVSNIIWYTAPSGAHVLDIGTEFWGWGVDDAHPVSVLPTHQYASRACQQLTANLIHALLERQPQM